MTNDQGDISRSPYISVDELKALQPNPHLILFDARISRLQRPDGTTLYTSGVESFREDGHIPDAIFADLFGAFSDPDAPFPFTRPSKAGLSKTLQSHGVDARSVIVVYDSLNGAWAARLWWVLKAAGLADVRLLDGGLSAWKAENGPLAYGEGRKPVAAAPFETESRPGLFVDLPEVLSILETRDSATLICALRETDFDAGHIPGSRLLAYPSILTGDGRVDIGLAEHAAQALQLAKQDRLVLYCGGGVNAAGLGIALHAIGYRDIAVYDGSLSEWKADPSRPLESKNRNGDHAIDSSRTRSERM